MNKHSPAPWTIEESRGPKDELLSHHIIDAENRIIFGTWATPNLANATLAAAAPELKVACEGALVALQLGEHVDKVLAIDFLREVLAKVECRA